MLDVLSITLPIFILIALGYVATRFGATSAADVRALGGFVLRFALPALIFKSLAQRPFAEIANGDYLLVYALGSLAAFAVAFAWARAWRPGDLAADAYQALGSSSSNSGFVGYPIALLVVGPPAAVALALCMAVENVIVIPLALTLAESAGHRGKSAPAIFAHILGRLARNPLIIGIALGAAASLSGIKLPTPIFRSVDMLALASGALALFTVGGSLVGLRLGGVVVDAARVVVGKLALHPLAVFAALTLTPHLDPQLRKAMLIYASAPMLGIYPLLGRSYGQEHIGAAALMAATALSFFTVSGLLLIL